MLNTITGIIMEGTDTYVIRNNNSILNIFTDEIGSVKRNKNWSKVSCPFCPWIMQHIVFFIQKAL